MTIACPAIQAAAKPNKAKMLRVGRYMYILNPLPPFVYTIMILPRSFTLIFRFAQCAFTLVALGITATLLDLGGGPRAPLIYGIVVACFSTAASLGLMIPRKPNILILCIDAGFCVAWFVAFALEYTSAAEYEWYVDPGLQPYVVKWRVVEAFSFLAGIAWGGSAGLGAVVLLSEKKAVGEERGG
jgi:hypothetical protein